MTVTAPSNIPGMGAVLRTGVCGFRVWAPNAADVRLIGDFNDYQFDPASDKTIWLWREGDYWSAEVADVTAGQRYEFVIRNAGGAPWNDGGTHFRHDPYALDTCHDTGKSIVVDVDDERHASGLAGDPFATPNIQDLVCYQMHVGTFRGRNDGVAPGDDGAVTFAQVAQHFRYIRELGFNAICLLPDIENQGDLSMGYGPIHLFATESAYGKPVDLRRFVKLAHEAELSVIADVIYNHFTYDGNQLWNYDGYTYQGGIYFTEPETKFGPRPANWRRPVRDFFLDHLRMLFHDYRFDGARFDAAHDISEEGLRHLVSGVRREPFWHSKVLIAEWTGGSDAWNWVTRDVGMDAVWALGDRTAAQEALDDMRFGPGHRLSRALELLDDKGLPGEAPLVRMTLGSHDNVKDIDGGKHHGNRYFVELLGGRGNWHARAKARMAWALAATLPGIPQLFMGSEWLQWGYWSPERDQHGDHRPNWNLAGDGIGHEMRNLVSTANALRFGNTALRGRNIQVVHRDYDNAVVGFKRWNYEGNVLLVVANFSDNEWPDYGVDMEGTGGQWREIFNSQSATFGGHNTGNGGSTRDSSGDSLRLYLPRWSTLVFLMQ